MTARYLEGRVWFFMFTEDRTAKFPLLQELVVFKHYRHNGDKKKVIYFKRSSRFPVKLHFVTDESVFRNSIYVLLDKWDR